MNKNITRRDFLRGTLAGAAVLAIPRFGSVAHAEGTEELSYEQKQKWDAEFDVVVIGYGMAGGVAAVSAADQGAKVLLIEKAPKGHEGGNSRYSGQGILTVDGGEANRDAAVEYFKRVRGMFNTPEDDILEAFTDSLLKAFDWFQAHGGNPMMINFPAGEFKDIPGHELMYAWSQEGKIHNAGTYLALCDIVNNTENITVWYDAAAEHFVQDPETKIVHGLTANVAGQNVAIRAQDGIVLTAGGFENNINMIQQYHQLPYAYAKGALYNTGDGIRMAQEIGAELWHMSNTAGPDLNAVDPSTNRSYGYAIVGPHPLLSTGFSLNSVIIVGADGTRFTSESVMPGHGYVDFHGRKIQQPLSLPAYLVFDQEAFGKTIYATWDNEEKVKDGTIVKADTLDELTEKLSLPEGSLAATVTQYNQFCKDGKDIVFNRDPDTLIALSETGPYYAFEVKPTYTNTQGGPRRNKDGCVLDVNGKPIPHLYSAGECGSIWGDIYQGAGNLGECFAFGMISGKNAASKKNDSFQGSVVAENVDFSVKEESVTAGEGEYIGEGNGIGGPVRVKVTVADSKIVNIEILEQNETPAIGGKALETLLEEAKAVGSAEIDGVSGATATTNAFVKALNDALTQAGLV